MEQIPQIQDQYESRRQEVEQQPAEQQETTHETMSHVVEQNIQQHMPQFQASTHAARSTDDSLPPEEKAKVDMWLNDVFAKGLDVAIKEASDSGDAALLDAFHAALTGVLHDQLIAQKKLENLQ